MIVMAIIAIICRSRCRMYQKSIVRSKESVLKNNLFTLRTVIDEYTYDKQKAPQTLQDLVREGYLRAVPMTRSPVPIRPGDHSWRTRRVPPARTSRASGTCGAGRTRRV